MSIGLTKEQQEQLEKKKTEEDTKSGLTQRVEQLEKNNEILEDVVKQLVCDMYGGHINSLEHTNKMIFKLMEIKQGI